MSFMTAAAAADVHALQYAAAALLDSKPFVLAAVRRWLRVISARDDPE
jgi:hypothetical protein